MKSKLQSLIVAVALSAAASSSINAALVTSSTTPDYYSGVGIGDIIFGVMNSSGSGNSLMLDLGPVSGFSYLQSGNTLNISSDLTAAGLTTTNLVYGIYGIGGSTQYASSTNSTPYANPSSGSLNAGTYSGIVGVSSVFGNMADAGQNTASGVYIANSDSQSWSSQQLNGFGFGNLGNGALNAAMGKTNNFFAMLANVGGTGYGSQIGYFNLTTNGIVSYTAVPEPSSWALIGIGLSVAGIAIYRRRSVAK